MTAPLTTSPADPWDAFDRAFDRDYANQLYQQGLREEGIHPDDDPDGGAEERSWREATRKAQQGHQEYLVSPKVQFFRTADIDSIEGCREAVRQARALGIIKKERGQTAERTELRNAELLIERAGEGLRHVGPWNKGLTWDGARWRLDEDGGWERAAKRVARLTYEETAAVAEPYRTWERECAATLAKVKSDHRATMHDEEIAKKNVANARETVEPMEADVAWAKRSQDAAKLRATITLARTDSRVAVHHDQLDRDLWLLNVTNGTIDLRTGTLQPHDRDDLMTKLAPVAFDAEARCPTWDAFLARAMGGDTELVGYLARLVGYGLTGNVGEHVLVFLYGAGANGKSTFLSTVHAMLGDYATPAPRGLLFRARGERHPTELASLHGRRFVTCSEIEEGQTFDEALTKDLTGGDPIECRRMREDFWSYTPTHKLFIAGNHKPTVRGDDEGIWRRMRLVPWTVTIPEAQRDTSLLETLRAELPGILAWAVRGCLEWQRRGLAAPAAVTEATKSYRQENDLLGEFFDAHCKIEADGKVPRHVLREEYEAFCKASGAEPFGAKRFSGRIRELGAKETTMRWAKPAGFRWENGVKYVDEAKSKVVPAWSGVRLLTEDERAATLPTEEQALTAAPAEQLRVPAASGGRGVYALTTEDAHNRAAR
jgi:putative DNA primase/helicase